MPESILVALNISVAGGPKLAGPQTIGVDAYDKIKVNIEAGDANEDGEIEPVTKMVDVQPGAAGKVQFLFINSDEFSTAAPDKKLNYKVNTMPTQIELDAPLLLVGDGAVSLLGEAPGKLTFTSTLGKPVNIEILVGRNV